ncbi:MAG: alginate export family protein [Fimbriiglobus sp.]
MRHGWSRLVCAALLLSGAIQAQDPATPPVVEPLPAPPPAPTPPADPLLFETGPLRVKLAFEATTQTAWAVDSWWLLSNRFAPDANYAPDRVWTEGWVRPGILTDLSVTDLLSVYSGVSYVGSGNLGRDVFDQGYRGLWAVEDAYFGFRYGDVKENKTIDISYGRQPYKIGSGMLVAVGAYNGFERGATTTFARRAWEEAALAKFNYGPFSFDTFYLKPNELRSGNTDTQLAGSKAEVSLGQNQYLGLAYLNVFNSTYPYLAAPIRLIEDGRDGLNTLHTYTRVNPLREDLPGLYVAGDFAYQWKDTIDLRAFGYSAEVGHNFGKLPLKPTLAYAFRSFSGDNPETARVEKFDPLFYEGAPPLWASGSNGSFAFLNSNVLLHRISLALTVTPRDYINMYYWHVRADRVNSPLQFGQSGRLEVIGGEPRLVAGVPNAHLSDDFYIEYTRAITQNIYLTTGFAASVPGRGLREIGGTNTWFGGLVNLSIKY